MGLVDTYQWMWVSSYTYENVMFVSMIVCLSIIFLVSLLVKYKAGLLSGFILVFLVVSPYIYLPHPTIEKVISLYARGEIDKNELKKFASYAMEDKRERERIKKEKEKYELMRQKEEDVLKKEEEDRRKEAEWLIKKLSEEKWNEHS